MLCPSFFHAEIVQNPNLMDRITHRFRTAVIGMFTGSDDPSDAPAPRQDTPEDIRVAAE